MIENESVVATPCSQSLMFFALFSSSHARALEEAHASPPLLMIKKGREETSIREIESSFV